jgi:putative ABC transport system substrate-binding protein
MRRRNFIALLASAGAWPLAASAQQAVLPMVGFLRSTSLLDATHLVAAFRQGLKDAGYDHGQNVAIEYRSAEDDHDKLRALVGELVRRSAVIVGNTPSALAAKAATTTVPIVFVTGSDPVSDGLVTSVNRPGGNLTGASFLAGELGAKRLELLRQVAPKDSAIAVLVNPA